MVFVIGGTLAFFFEFLLLSKKNKSLADKLLAVWMFMLGLHLFLFYFTDTQLDFKYTFLLGIIIPFPFLHGPMLYLYTATITGKLKTWRMIYLLHFVPFLFFYVYYAEFFVLSPQEKIDFVNKFIYGYEDIYTKYSYPAMLVSAITYLVLIFFMIKRHQRDIKEFYSYSSEKINLHWLRNLLIGMAVIWAVVIISDIWLEDMKSDEAIYVTVVLFVISMGYFGIRQGNIFTTPQLANVGLKNNDGEGSNTKRYSKSGLKDTHALEIQNKLKILMEEEKLFLDETLSLTKLSELIGVLPNYLSQVINERFEKNFYDFVNSYRIEEFKKLAVDTKNKNKTLLALAMDSGFASKASFNSTFKRNTGQTPTEYLNNLQKN